MMLLVKRSFWPSLTWCLIVWSFAATSRHVDASDDMGSGSSVPAPSAIQPTPSPTFVRRTPYPTVFRSPSYYNNIDDNNDNDPDNVGTQFIITMCVGVLIAICCGCNLGYVALANYQDAETAAREFREDIMDRQFLVVTIPAGSIPLLPCCCCTTTDKSKKKGENSHGCSWNRQKYALFFTTRIKLRWKPLHTYMQFFLGWVSLVTTLIGLIDPANGTNSIIGSASLFLSELVVHTWYGFLRYPNLATAGGFSSEGDDIFEEMKHLFGVLYHNGDPHDKFARWIDFVCFPFLLPLHVASFLGTVFTCIACCVLDDNPDFDFSILIGVLLGAFCYPLIFLLSTGPGGILLASVAHHIVSEYYEAKLFRKTGKQFLSSVGFKAFSELVGVDNFGAEGDGFHDAANQLHGRLDAKPLDEDNDDKDNNDPEVGGVKPDETFDNSSGSNDSSSGSRRKGREYAGSNNDHRNEDNDEDYDPAGVNDMSDDDASDTSTHRYRAGSF